MTSRFRGFNNTVISVPNKRGLNTRQVKQVQKIVNSNKRIKNYYTPLEPNIVANISLLYFQELTLIPFNGSDAQSRQTSNIQLKSYNIKLGLVENSTPSLITVAYRVIIARSKQGPVTDISSTTGPIIDFNDQPDPDIYQVYTDEIFSPVNISSGAGGLGYLMHFYKSFKSKKVPHMIVGYNDVDNNPATNPANNNPIYMKVIVDPATGLSGTNGFGLKGFAHMKFFDKE